MIPIRNIWLLMLYASELPEVMNKVDSSLDHDRDDFHNLIAEYLVSLVEKRLQRNLSFGYEFRSAELSRVRGQINFLATERGQLLSKGKISCQFQELTINTLKNRLVLSALDKVSTLVTDNEALVHKCKVLVSRLQRIGVVVTRPSTSEINSIQLGRNDSDDRAMVTVSKLVFNYKLPNQSTGNQFIYSPERDDVWLRALFENAVRGFYKNLLKDEWRLNSKRRLFWNIDYEDEGIKDILPNMEADIILDNLNQKKRIVIDTKFTSILKKNQHGNEKLKSGYIYQMYAYLMSQRNSGDFLDQNSTGILLHPALNEMIDKTVVIQGSPLRFMTVDLAAPSFEIRKQLLNVLKLRPVS